MSDPYNQLRNSKGVLQSFHTDALREMFSVPFRSIPFHSTTVINYAINGMDRAGVRIPSPHHSLDGYSRSVRWDCWYVNVDGYGDGAGGGWVPRRSEVAIVVSVQVKKYFPNN